MMGACRLRVLGLTREDIGESVIAIAMRLDWCHRYRNEIGGTIGGIWRPRKGQNPLSMRLQAPDWSPGGPAPSVNSVAGGLPASRLQRPLWVESGQVRYQ